ncbi:hypothetical protein BsWGS_03701 [Bradybaena similaris]
MGRTDILRMKRDNVMKSEMIIGEITGVLFREWGINCGTSSRDRGRGRNRVQSVCNGYDQDPYPSASVGGVTERLWDFPNARTRILNHDYNHTSVVNTRLTTRGSQHEAHNTRLTTRGS